MEIHLNGFHDGDPELFEAVPERYQPRAQIPSQLDVLIVGSGPAGLTLAAQLAAFPQITTRIIEQKGGPMTRGQADGVSCRSMEMFNAFGFGELAMREGYWVNEVTFWMPDTQNSNHITRVGRVQDVEDGLSEMPHIILNQARVHDMYINVMRKSPTRLAVDYNRRVTDLKIESETKDYPVTVQLEHLGAENQGQAQIVHARYVVGCDGARSSVRTAIGRELKGDYAYQSWGVMDVLAVTDFPDIRFKCIIKSANQGNVLIIPREGEYLVRLYVELDSLGKRGESKDTTLEQVIDAAQRIFEPYTFDVKDVAWWSVYEIGHSLTDKFDDVPENNSASQMPHVFIAGDACHTHSAKAGQGMNVSMGDTFNLGWKLISVLTGKCAPDLLRTYSAERHAVAQDLIDFDHQWSRVMSAPPESSDTDDVAPPVQQHFVAGRRFTAGLGVKYKPSRLTGEPIYQALAPGFEIGARFHSAPVIRLGDARPMHLGHTIKADTKWHLFAFADSGDPAASDSRISKLCNFLSNSQDSPIVRYTPNGSDVDSVISIAAIFQQEHRSLEFEAMPDLLKPRKGRYQVKSYEKMFCPDLNSGEDIYQMRGIDRHKGCILIVRPDQYVAHLLPLDGYDELRDFFAGFLLTRN